MSTYIDMDITMERMNDEIDTCDKLIGEHIEAGVQMKDLWSLARLRANLSNEREALDKAMDDYEGHDEVHYGTVVEEDVDFDSEITMSGRGFVALDTIR